MRLPRVHDAPAVRRLIQEALREDVGRGDITTRSLVSSGARAEGVIVSRGPCVVSGARVACQVFLSLDRRMRCRVMIPVGHRASAGDEILRLSGNARAMLTAERTALNLMQRMTGIATLTDSFVTRIRRYSARILDTRKTVAGMRLLEKYAVRCGGGHNHRMGLHDMVLIKDNHRLAWRAKGKATLAAAIRRARKMNPGVPIEIEVENESEMRDAIRERPEWILLDNMSPGRIRRCVALRSGRTALEASGGISLKNVARIAATGVDAISVGSLTHSASAADLSLDIRRVHA